MNKHFKLGDKVLLSPFSDWVNTKRNEIFDDEANPLDMVGEVVDGSVDGFTDVGNDVYVKWQNDFVNSYDAYGDDLIAYFECETKHDACLRVKSFPIAGERMHGDIFNDKAERFVTGTTVSTSRVVSIVAEHNMWFIKTRNTTYKMFLKEVPSIQSAMTTHEFAKLLLANPDVPMYTCRYEGDLEGEYDMMLSEVRGIDFGIVKDGAVVCVDDVEISIEELENMGFD